MSVVKRRILKGASPANTDSGVSVKKALELIVNSQYYEDVIQIFDLKSIENDFIEIPGASKVVENLIEVDEECLKIDIDTQLSDVNISKFTKENEILLEFFNVQNPRLRGLIQSDRLFAESVYSVKSEYLNDMYQIEKYMDFCLRNHYSDIIDTNLEMLQEKNKENKKQKKFRLLRRDDGHQFIRAITSVDVYKDYNLRFSLFITLIELHKLVKHKSHSYYVESYSMTESDLKVVFKSAEKRQISKDVEIGFSLELINDEIRRDAFKINGIFSVIFDKAEIFVKPDETTSNILSIAHSLNVQTLKQRLETLSEQIGNFVDETVDDAKSIKVIDRPDLFREHLLYKLQFSRNVEFNKLYKKPIQQLLSNKVKTIFELSEIFKKVEVLIVDDHIESLDFWRYKLYQVLLESIKTK